MRGRYPWIAAAQAHLREVRTIGPKRRNERRKVLLNRIGPTLQEAFERGEIDSTDPTKIGEREILFLDEWMRSEGFADGYKDTIYDHVSKFLRANHNTILDDLEDRGVWKRPRADPEPRKPKEIDWVQGAVQRLEAATGWRAEVLRFVLAFCFLGVGVRPCELRLADVDDLNVRTWMFSVTHPKPGSSRRVGDELRVYPDARTPTLDFLAAREKRLREVDLDGRMVKALIPNEKGEHYGEGGFRNLRWKTLKSLGLDPRETGDEWFSYQDLRASHEQALVDALEAENYKEGAVIEVSAKRMGHTPEVARKHYVRLRTRRAQEVAERAWETHVTRRRARLQSALIDAES